MRNAGCPAFPFRITFHVMSNEPVNPSSKGWGVAIFIIVLAIIANVTAYSIHKATYLKPDAKKPASAEHAK